MVCKNKQCQKSETIDRTRRQFTQKLALIGAGLSVPLPLLAAKSCLLEDMMEQEKCLSAKYNMLFASPYDSAKSNSSPHMHQQLKNNIHAFSKGKIYLNVFDNGVLGVGTDLAALVARGSIQAALISVSNLTPILPSLDILNIPFWCAEQQNYLNLISSRLWQTQVISEIQKQGKLSILMHYVPGARTATSTKYFGATLSTPDVMKNVVFRIPASKALRQFYELCETSPVDVPWKKVATLAQGGRIQALDPSIVGLFNGPNNLKQHLGVISQINSVQDGWLLVVNQPWFNTLPKALQTALYDAAHKTFSQHLQSMPNIARYCESALKKMGTSVYLPNQDEMQQWKAAAGHQRAEWLPFKNHLLDGEKRFTEFYEAAHTQNKISF